MLDPRSRCVLDSLLPSRAHPDLPKGLFEAGFETFLDDFDRTALPAMRLGLRAALFSAAWLSPLLVGRLPPITRLSPADRVRALEAMGTSRVYLLRQCMLLIKAVACFCYGADAEVRRAIGVPEA